LSADREPAERQGHVTVMHATVRLPRGRGLPGIADGEGNG